VEISFDNETLVPRGGQSGCLYCVRVWWFVNSTIVVPATALGQNHTEFNVKDTDLMDVRSTFLKLAYNPGLVQRIVERSPHAIGVLLRDWLKDDTAYDIIVRHMRRPVQFFDDCVHMFVEMMLLQSSHPAATPATRPTHKTLSTASKLTPKISPNASARNPHGRRILSVQSNDIPIGTNINKMRRTLSGTDDIGLGFRV